MQQMCEIERPLELEISASSDQSYDCTGRVVALNKAAKSREERIAKSEESPSLDLFNGFIKLHVLDHASDAPVYGLWLIEELGEHGYRVSPGTLYPLLHSLEQTELLKSYNELHAGKIRRYYKITSNGRRQLKRAKLQMIELMGEILSKEEFERLSASLAVTT